MVDEKTFHEYRRTSDVKIDELRQDLTDHTAEERARDVVMLEKVNELSEKVDGLIHMWDQAKGAVTFVKIMAAIAASGMAIWSFFKGGH